MPFKSIKVKEEIERKASDVKVSNFLDLFIINIRFLYIRVQHKFLLQ